MPASGHTPQRGTIAVTRRRPGFHGFISRFRVFIDEDCVGTAPRGATASFSVAPGPHTVWIITKGQRGRSNDLTVAVAPGTTCSLECRFNPARVRGLNLGIALENPPQVRTYPQEDGVNRAVILLYEQGANPSDNRSAPVPPA